jgi:hypothetical protein
MALPQVGGAEITSKKTILAFMSNVSDHFKKKKYFETYYDRIVSIQKQIKLISGIRDMKKAVILRMFDKEKRYLIDFHQKRAKKNKASKKIVL